MPRSEDCGIIRPNLSGESSISCQKRPSKGLCTLLAVSPFLAILSAPTTREIVSGATALDIRSHTNGVDFVMLEQRPDHAVTNHDGRDAERDEFQGSEPASTPSVTNIARIKPGTNREPWWYGVD